MTDFLIFVLLLYSVAIAYFSLINKFFKRSFILIILPFILSYWLYLGSTADYKYKFIGYVKSKTKNGTSVIEVNKKLYNLNSYFSNKVQSGTLIKVERRVNGPYYGVYLSDYGPYKNYLKLTLDE